MFLDQSSKTLRCSGLKSMRFMASFAGAGWTGFFLRRLHVSPLMRKPHYDC